MSNTEKVLQQENILIVDDNPANLSLLSKILSDAGYKVRAAISSKIALKAVELSLPDLILLDILMPDMDGYQVCERLKSSPTYKNIPIIFISALNEVIDKVKAFSVGGVDYITKPFQAEEVLARVENQLRVQRLSKQLLEQNIQLQQELLERQRAEQALRESQSLLKGIIEGTIDQIAALDLEFRYIAFNTAYKADFLKIFGRDIEIGTSLIEALSHLPREQTKAVEMWSRALAGDEFTVIQEFGDSDRERNYYEITYSSIRDSNGQRIGASHIIKNVSDRIRAEQALRDSERRLTFALVGAKAGCWEFNPTTHQTVWSHENFKLLGYEPGSCEVHYDNWINAIHPEDRERAERYFKQVIEENSELALEYRVLLPDNTVRWLRAIGQFIEHERGKLSIIAGIQIDITERKQLEQELAHQKELLDAFFNSAHVGMCALDHQMRYFLVNEALATINGVSVTDHIGKTLWEIVPDLATEVEAIFQQVLTTGQPVSLFEISGETSKYPGVTRTWLESYFPIRGETHQPIGIGMVVVEITERKRAEKALRESEAKLQAILDNAPAVIYLKDLQGRHILVNRYFLNVLNIAPEQCIGKTDAEIFPLDIAEQIQTNDRIVLQSKESSQFEEQILLADEIHTYYSVKFPLCDESGNPYAICGISTDVSDRIRTEQALRESEERFRNAFDYGAIGMALVATDGRWLKVNRALCEITGYSEQDLLASTFQAITHPDDLETNLAFVNQLLADKIRVYHIEKRYVHKQGHIVWVLLSASIVRDPQGQPLYFIAQVQDISDVYDELRLRKQAEELLKASLKEKEVLLKEIHHRVKNNLQIVSSLLQMQTRRTQDSQTSLILKDSKNRISSIALVHEKLYRSDDLANIDFAQYIPDLTTHLFESYKVRLEQVTLHIQIEEIFLEIETAIPCGLIINELVSNSLKYAFPGKRKGEIYVEFHTNKDDTLTLIVRDNGIGIPEELDIETTTSLGLTLVQGLAEQLEGTLELDRSRGTVFKITFAAPKVAKVKRSPT
ncbi:MAG: PAS domain S-box protein [Cyanobacteriota bacterium]